MSKSHRGKGLTDLLAHGRGVCPICKRSGVKLVYEHEVDGTKQNICKICRATEKNKKAAASSAS